MRRKPVNDNLNIDNLPFSKLFRAPQQPQTFLTENLGGINKQEETPCRSMSTFWAIWSIIVSPDSCDPPAVPAPLNVRLLYSLRGTLVVKIKRDRERARCLERSHLLKRYNGEEPYNIAQGGPNDTVGQGSGLLSVKEAGWNGRSDACSPSIRTRFRSCTSWVNSPVTSRQSCYLPSVHYLLRAENSYLAIVSLLRQRSREKRSEPRGGRASKVHELPI